MGLLIPYREAALCTSTPEHDASMSQGPTPKPTFDAECQAGRLWVPFWNGLWYDSAALMGSSALLVAHYSKNSVFLVTREVARYLLKKGNIITVSFF